MITQRRGDERDLNTRARAWLDAAGRLGPDRIELSGGQFAVGDRVVLKLNDRRLNVENGNRGTVIAIDPGAGTLGVQLSGQRVVTLPPAYLDRKTTIGDPALLHAYAGTAHIALLLAIVGVMSDELARHLHAQTAGIPFALEELVRMHRDKLELVDSWQTVEELDDLAVPPAVRQSLRERMASLPSDAWLVTRAAAVLGAPAGEELIRSVTGLSAAGAMKGLGCALEAAVLAEHAEGKYGFIHALAAQAVYAEVTGPERRWLHRCAAQALQAGPVSPPLAQLAHHFHEAGQARQWAHYVEAAADAAGDRRTLRAMKIRSHLRACAGGRDFETALHHRPAQLAAIVPPLPLGLAAAMLHSVLGGSGHGGGLAAGLSAGAGQGRIDNAQPKRESGRTATSHTNISHMHCAPNQLNARGQHGAANASGPGRPVGSYERPDLPMRPYRAAGTALQHRTGPLTLAGASTTLQGATSCPLIFVSVHAR